MKILLYVPLIFSYSRSPTVTWWGKADLWYLLPEKNKILLFDIQLDWIWYMIKWANNWIFLQHQIWNSPPTWGEETSLERTASCYGRDTFTMLWLPAFHPSYSIRDRWYCYGEVSPRDSQVEWSFSDVSPDDIKFVHNKESFKFRRKSRKKPQQNALC